MTPHRTSSREKAERLIAWTRMKIRIEARNGGALYYDEREIWWANIGENVGSEINGKHDVFERPVIVMRKLGPDMLFAVPITSKIRSGSWYQTFLLGDTARTAIVGQTRLMSSSRLVRKMGKVSPEDFHRIIRAYFLLIKTEPPAGAGGSSDPLARTK